MGKKTGKVPVKESIGAKVMDRQPVRKAGDAWARGLSEEKMQEYARQEGMMNVWQTVMQKAVIHDAEGNEINPAQMKDSVPYLISPQESDKNIGWVMRKGISGVGRIYNENIDSYEDIKNDPDRPGIFDNVNFEGATAGELGVPETAAYVADNTHLGESGPTDTTAYVADDVALVQQNTAAYRADHESLGNREVPEVADSQTDDYGAQAGL